MPGGGHAPGGACQISRGRGPTWGGAPRFSRGEAPLGPGSLKSAGTAAPPGPGPVFQAGARCPAGANTGPGRHWLITKTEKSCMEQLRLRGFEVYFPYKLDKRTPGKRALWILNGTTRHINLLKRPLPPLEIADWVAKSKNWLSGKNFIGREWHSIPSKKIYRGGGGTVPPFMGGWHSTPIWG